MSYQVPVDDIVNALKTAAGLDDLIKRNILGGVDEDTIRAVIAEAGKFGAEVLEPLSAPGDRAGVSRWLLSCRQSVSAHVRRLPTH